MRNLLLNLTCAVLMFLVGSYAAIRLPSFGHASNVNVTDGEMSRFAAEAAVLATVFRYQIEHSGQPKEMVYYLACYNYSDPSESVMAELARSGLKAKRLSQLPFDPNQFDSDRAFMKVGQIRLMNQTEALVGGSLRTGPWVGGAQSYIYRVTLQNQSWKVVSAETIN